MLTPQEVSSHAFPKAVMGGYSMSAVDEFLDELTEDYSARYKENTALKAKLKVLVEKVEEYRSTEDSMRWRRSIFSVTNPYVPVDTDSQWNYCIDPDYRRLLDVGEEIGIPTIYNAEYLRRGHFFFKPDYRRLDEGDYRKIAEVFERYRRGTKNGRTANR